MDAKKPFVAVLLIQTIYAGMFLVSKAAFNVGMNNFIFVFYRQAAATVFLVPIAIIFERITLSLDVNGVALIYTSATLAAATTNCLPVITFFLAVLLRPILLVDFSLEKPNILAKPRELQEILTTYILCSDGPHAAEESLFLYSTACIRMETVKLRTSSGMAKIAGVLICIAGAATIAFYKGPHLQLMLHHHLFGHQTTHEHQSHVSSGATWVKGCLLMLMSNTFWGLWLVLQAYIMKSYPAKLLLTTLQCLLSSIQSFFIAIALERDPDQWKLGWNVKLVAVAYTGIVVTGVTYYLQTWVIEKKGPVFLAMSTPFALIITIFCSAIFLGEAISLGSILGGILLVGGLYSVLWGKSKEQKMEKTCSTAQAEKETELKEEVAAQSPPPPFFV
ncbi:WAT1-related protein [Vitis vinifera]|uniref:WAT1-related protein n=1 Tax=Vitis vinifera TaxID=29760 RepID=A0A438HMJ6_VITVI|nr:WAT1-related protein [Vitis vinifera]